MNNTHDDQVKHYSELFRKHPDEPMAVSSESAVHKRVRFDQIAGLFKNESEPFTLHDVGMGMAHYWKYLQEYHPDLDVTYSGTEVVPEYHSYCERSSPDMTFALRDLAEAPGDDMYDYVILSGVFHQMRNSKRRDWEQFAYAILENSFAMCRKGMAFNFISPFVDFYQTEVYYCDMMKMLHAVRDRMSRFFEIRHNYALFEFTVFVYPEQVVKDDFPEPEMAKYFPTSGR